MNKVISFVVFLCFIAINSNGQTLQDTAKVPYWIDMMQDRSVNFYETKRAFDIYWTGRTITKGSGYKPFMRWATAMERIIDEKGNIPDPQTAVDEYQLFLNLYGQGVIQPGLGSGPAPCNKKGDWKELGPYGNPSNQPSQPNGNGRINGLDFHPTDSNIMWAGAPQGGLWKTVNGGKNWTSNTDALVTLGVSDIAVNTSNPSIIYIGTGDRDGGDAAGRGVYKSTNGGTTWAASNTGMGNRTIAKLVLDPNDNTNLLAASTNGVYRSTNSGGTWTRTLVSGSVKDLVYKPGSSDTVYATSAFRFYRSLNKGVTWTQITSGLPTAGNRGAIAVCKAAPNVVYYIVTNSRTFRGMYVSTDGGSTFRTMSTTPNIMDYSHLGTGTGGQAWYDLDIAVDPKRPGDVYVGGVNIFKSQDTGKTWLINAHWVGSGGAPAVHADNHVLEFSPLTNAMIVGNDGGVYKATANGSKYEDITADLRIAQIYRLSQSATNKNWIINGYQDNGTGMMRGNKKWFTVMGGDGMDCQIDPSTTQYAYSDLYYGDVRRYTNGVYSGKIAANGTNGITESGAWVTSFILQEGTPSTMFIGYDNVWRSTNIRNGNANTVTWTRISSFANSSDIHFLENCISDPKVMYVSKKDGYMYKTTNANVASSTWTQLARPTTTYPRWIETDPKNSNTVYIAQSNNIYKSTNGGASWTDISSNLPNSTINCIVYDTSLGSEALYVGMNVGVYYKDATMSNWVLYNQHLPATSEITDLDIYYDKVNPECSHIVASTYGRGNWKSYLYPSTARKPKPEFYAVDTTITLSCNSKSVQLVNESCDFPTRYLWKVEPAVSYIGGTTDSSENPIIQFSAAGNYTVTLYAENCNGLDSTTKLAYIHVYDSIKAVTCTNGFANRAGHLGIFNLSFAGYSRGSGGSATEGTYVDNSCTEVVRLQPSTTYPMTVNVGTLNNEGVRVYIDYNNDGDFVDAGELVATSNPKKGLHSFSFTTPASPIYNTVLRMRVLSNFSTLPSGPCATLNYGQSENYGLYFELSDVEIRASLDTVCPGEIVEIIDSSVVNAGLYTWNFGPGAIPSTAIGKGPHKVQFFEPGYKSVTLNAGGSIFSKDSLVFVKAGPSLETSLPYGTLTACEGDSLILKSVDTNSVSPTYQWYKNATALGGKTDSLLTFGKISFTDSGSYYAIASKNGCSDTSAAMIVDPSALPNAIMGVTGDTVQCKGSNNFVFTNSSSISKGTLSYNWNFGDGNSASTTTATHSYVGVGYYPVKLVATSDKGCKDSVQRTMTVISGPSASFTIADTSKCEGEGSFSFTNQTGGSSSYLWKFGDDSTSTNSDATHLYLKPGSFTVTLIATANSCVDSVSKTVHYFEKPNVGYTVNQDTQCLTGNDFQFKDTTKIGDGTLSRAWSLGDGTSSILDSLNHSYNSLGTKDIKLVVGSSNGCSDSVSGVVFLNPTPQAQFAANDSAQCLNENYYVFTNVSSISSGFMRFEWDFGNDSTSTIANGIEEYAKEGNYTVTLRVYSVIGNCVDSTTRMITVDHSPVSSVVLNRDTQCFLNHSFDLTNTSSIAVGTVRDSFSFGDGTFSKVKNPQKSYLKDTTYRLTHYSISDKGCMDTTGFTVVVQPSPTAGFTVVNDDTSQCYKTNRFNLTNTSFINKGVYTSTWELGDGISSTSKDISHKYLAEGNYEVLLIAESGDGCLDTARRVLYVLPEVKLGFEINKDTQCFTNHLFSFTDTSSISSGTYSRLWKLGDGDTSTVPALAKIYGLIQNYDVKLIGTTDKGCSDSLEKRIVLLHTPTARFSINDSGQCIGGNNFVFTNSSITTGGILSYKWDFGDGSSSTLKDPSAIYNGDSVKLVSLVAKVLGGCSDTLVVPVEIYPLPNVTFTIDDSLQCLSGNTFRFKDNSTLRYGAISRDDWSFGDGSTFNSKDASHIYGSDGEYTVVKYVETAFGCVDSFTSKLEVYETPQVDFTINRDSQCFVGNDFVFTNGSLVGKGTLQYKWDMGDGSGVRTTRDVQQNYLKDSLFGVKMIAYSDKGCEDSISQNIVVMPNPVASFTVNDSSQCLNGNTFVFTNTSTVRSGLFNSNWDFGDGNTNNSNGVVNHSYSLDKSYQVSLEAITPFGCKSQTTGDVITHPIPFASITSSKFEDCLKGNLFTFSDDSKIGKGTITGRTWYFGDGDSSLNSVLERHSYPDSGVYDLVLRALSERGCSDDTLVKITIHPHPVSLFETQNVCLGDTADFTYTGSADATQYLWRFGDGTISKIEHPRHKYRSSTSYNVNLVVTTANGCSDTVDVPGAITIYPKPVASFESVKTASSYKSATITYTNLTTDATIWEWDFGDGQVSFDKDPSNTFADTGTYLVRLIAMNDNGCLDTAYETKFVFPDYVYHVPNSFTPNEDGLNDVWGGVGLAYSREFSMVVYNRWGESMFESTDPQVGWDGKYNGELVMNGVYVYVIRIVALNGDVYNLKGEVSVIR